MTKFFFWQFYFKIKPLRPFLNYLSFKILAYFKFQSIWAILSFTASDLPKFDLPAERRKLCERSWETTRSTSASARCTTLPTDFLVDARNPSTTFHANWGTPTEATSTSCLSRTPSTPSPRQPCPENKIISLIWVQPLIVIRFRSTHLAINYT